VIYLKKYLTVLKFFPYAGAWQNSENTVLAESLPLTMYSNEIRMRKEV